MTKKDYIKIAKILREEREEACKQTSDQKHITHVTVIDNLTLELCKLFEEDNKRFDAERFKSAVNVYLN